PDSSRTSINLYAITGVFEDGFNNTVLRVTTEAIVVSAIITNANFRCDITTLTLIVKYLLLIYYLFRHSIFLFFSCSIICRSLYFIISIASAVSASASFQGLPPSLESNAENSCLRRLVIAAALKSTSARTLGSVSLHVLKASLAASIAFSACSLLALETKPTVSSIFEGL